MASTRSPGPRGVNKRQRKKLAQKEALTAKRILAFTLTNDKRHIAGIPESTVRAFYRRLFPKSS